MEVAHFKHLYATSLNSLHNGIDMMRKLALFVSHQYHLISYIFLQPLINMCGKCWV